VKGLHLVQLDSEFQYLEQWEKCLADRECTITREQGKLIHKQQRAFHQQKKIYARLHNAKAASHLTPLLPDQPGGPEMSFPILLNLTHTQPKQRDNAEKGATGVGPEACCMGTKAKTAPSLINDAQSCHPVAVSSRHITWDTTPLSTTLKPALTKEATIGKNRQACMPRGNRLKYENGLDVFSQDSPVQGLGHWPDEIGEAGSTIAVETERRMGGGIIHKDSRLNS